MNFMSIIVLSDPKLTSPVNFSNFQREENFSFSEFLDVSMRKEQQQPTWLINFAKNLLGHTLRIKTTSFKVLAS